MKNWFKNKSAAKKTLKQACEKARKDESLVRKAYSFLGI